MLKRKLWRDIKGNYGAYLACISVLVIGLMLYVSFSLVLDSMRTSRENYYREYNFADGFVQIVKGPVGLVDDLLLIDGIEQAAGRVVQDVMVHRPSGEETTTLRLISFEEQKPHMLRQLNSFKLETGRLPVEGQKEILVTPAFLTANGYKLGDRIPLIILGREIQFAITGTMESPEYIYEIPNGQMLIADPKVFGIAVVPYNTLAPLFRLEGQINEAVFSLQQGVDFTKVKLAVSRMVKSYGLTRLYPRKNQLSYSMLDQEMDGLKGAAITTPVIFLLVAASIMYIVLRRMIEQQRGQIGVLKAFGLTDWEIVRHYLGYAVLIGGAGGLGGSLAGCWLSYALANLYKHYYKIPNLTGKFSLIYILAGTALSLVFSVFAGYQGCKGVLALNPSEAMRPPAPGVVRKTFVERLRLLWQMLGTQGKMAVRNIFRSKQRSILAILGVASAFSMMVVTGASFDASRYLIDFQYEQVERYDLKVGLRQYADKTQVVTDVRYRDGVTGAEPLLEVPVTLSHKWLEKDIVITGLPMQGTLYRLLSKDGANVTLPSDGLVISNQLAKLLDIKPGDKVTVKPFLGERNEHLVQVRQIIPQYVGLGAYMEIEAMGRSLDMPAVTSSVLVKVDRDKAAGVSKELQEGKNVLVVQNKEKEKAQFEAEMEKSQASQYVLLLFSFITGFAIVYNVNIISLSERERELATLMVLGMTEREVGRILLYEQILLALIALILGIPLSYAMLSAIVNSSGTEIVNIPLIIEPGSFLTSFLGTVLFLATALWKIYGRIGKLSILDVLKQQE